MAMPLAVTVTEVGPRDGLQNESAHISTADKIAFIDRLSAAGLREIEVSSFVSAKRIPQLADAAEVFAGITKKPGTRYSALVPNMEGYKRALDAGVTEFAIFAAASETFSQRNTNRSIDESFTEYEEVATAAVTAGLRLRAYLSTAFGCPFEGNVPPERVVTLTRRLLDLGVFEVAVSDTIGVAQPDQVRAMLPLLLATIAPSHVALHFHDTSGTAIANVRAALDFGITTFDASAGGLGGCPFAPGAPGNVATEDVIEMLHGLGIETGVDLNAVSDAVLALAPQLGHPLSSRYTQARWLGGQVRDQWLEALEQRHLANLTTQEFTRAVRALSARYVERRGQLPDRSPLDSAGKRAAFALFYAPLHFLTAELALDRNGVRTDLTALVDLGCGTGVCGAAWALTSNVGRGFSRAKASPSITGVDANAWAIDEARWNWLTLGLRGHAVRGDLLVTARGLLRQSNTSLATTGIIAGWTINELSKVDRDQLLDVLDQLLARGATLVVLEPLARGVAPWWDEWAARLAPHGLREGDVKAEVDLPAPLDAFSDAAGFRKKELGVRAMSSVQT